MELTTDTIALLEQRLGYTFRDKALALQALTHRSYVGDFGTVEDAHSETLEFLGDAVIDLVVGALLMERFPDDEEGELTKKRAFLVNKNSLAKKAERLELGELVRLGKGEDLSKGRTKPSILADAFEAVFGAVFKDSGYDKVAELLEPLFSEINNIDGALFTHALFGDYKSALQEITQATHKALPTYRFVDTKGPEHHQVFCFEVLLNGEPLAQGSGHSKKLAQQAAAKKGLELLKARESQKTTPSH